LTPEKCFIFAVNQRVAGSSPAAGAKNQQCAEAAIRGLSLFANNLNIKKSSSLKELSR
jgi:hypothetical protein